MELPLDVQGGGSRLDVDKRIEQYRAVAGVLHVLVWFVLVLQMQHLQGIHTYREEASHTELLGL
jgi:alpha-N-acetylglucosamine transferase